MRKGKFGAVNVKSNTFAYLGSQWNVNQSRMFNKGIVIRQIINKIFVFRRRRERIVHVETLPWF
jgi:hypothetical membrane protein